MKIHAPKSHPRYASNLYRDILADGVQKGIVSIQGLTAHGRGETFDYLIGEKTCTFAIDAIKAAAAMLLLAEKPILCTNGNTTMLSAEALIKLSKVLNAPIEINLFHQSIRRETKIVEHFKSFGFSNILLPNEKIISGIKSNRKKVSNKGQKIADVIFVPLEDGDRTEALVEMGKKVIAVDLNLLSRTAQKAHITIVDNIVRTIPILSKYISLYKSKNKLTLKKIVGVYDNNINLNAALIHINKRLTSLTKKQ